MIRRSIVAPLIAILVITSAQATDKPSDKKAKAAPTSVDSGSFGILVNGKRVATETFHVDQNPDGSTISSELRFDDAAVKAVQSSELSMQPNGLLKKYTWKEVQPGKAQIIIEPQDEQFMVSHVSETSGASPKDTVHPLTPGTTILDANFFSHMEVLTWKYMAFGCKLNAQAQTECKWLPLRMPVFIPQQQQSVIAELSYRGVSKGTVAGKAGEFKTFDLVFKDPTDLKSEGGDCLLWFNDQNKLVRVVMASDNTEVLRD